MKHDLIIVYLLLLLLSDVITPVVYINDTDNLLAEVLDLGQVLVLFNGHLDLDLRHVLILNVLLDNIGDLRVRIHDSNPVLLANRISLDVSGALVDEQSLFVVCAVISTDHDLVGEPDSKLLLTVDLKSNIHASLLNKEYLMNLI